MKKIISFACITVMGFVMFSCGSKPNNSVQPETIQEIAIADSTAAQVDSLFALIADQLPTYPFKAIKNGAITLSDRDKKIKPDYLMPLSKAAHLQTLTQKHIALKIYVIDRAVAEWYGMNTNEYTEVIAKLMADVDVREFPFREGIDWKSPDANKIFLERTHAVIKEHKEKGELNYFIERVAASLIECTYLFAQNPEVYSKNLTDDNFAALSYQLGVMHLIVDKMSDLYPDMAPIRNVMDILEPINADNKKLFLEQLKAVTPQLTEARNSLI